MISVSVDRDLCQELGQCVYAAPQVFAFDDDEQLVYDASPPDSALEQVRAAVDACPRLAIHAVT